MKSIKTIFFLLFIIVLGFANTPFKDITIIKFAPTNAMEIITLIDNEGVFKNFYLVKRISISKTSLQILLLNRSKHEKVKPDFRIVIYNRYGAIIGKDNISWIFDTLAPNESRAENSTFTEFDYSYLLGSTGITIPPDFMTPKYVGLYKN